MCVCVCVCVCVREREREGRNERTTGVPTRAGSILRTGTESYSYLGPQLNALYLIASSGMD